MGTAHALAARETATIAEACECLPGHAAGPESAGTRRVYAGIVQVLVEDLGADTNVAELKPQALAA